MTSADRLAGEYRREAGGNRGRNATDVQGQNLEGAVWFVKSVTP